MKTSKKKLLLVALLALGVAASGCGKEGSLSSTSVTNPAVGELRPTGTVTGLLTDKVTGQPIVGAVVDIDGLTAATNENGQYSLHNVPATKDALNNTVTGTYTMTVNLKNVTSPVNMVGKVSTTNCGTAAAPQSCYPEFAYGTATVSYTSLNDSSQDLTIGTTQGDSSTNHDTPVTGLAAIANVSVGKLAATINGVVANQSTLQPVGAGFIVKLVSSGSTNAEGATGGTGNSGNIVGSTTTDADGKFSFANIESLQTFSIRATNSDGTLSGSISTAAPADGETKTLSIQQSTAVYVASTDAHAPFVISVSPENNADLSPTGGINVVFTFSEPIKADAYATTLSNNAVFGAATGLWKDVAVNFNGFKASNIAYTLSWSTDRKVLTVNIPTLAPAARYSVAITGTTGSLKDDTNLASIVAPAPTADYRTVNFTTNGAASAAVPSVTLVNDASMDVNSLPTLDWFPVSGAKQYNVYRATNEVWGATSNAGAYALIGTATTSNFTEAVGLPFVENSQIKLTYSYVVKSVNADGSESAASTAVIADDVVGPTITAATTLTGNPSVVTLTFNEFLDETTAETTANFIWQDAAARDTATTPAAITITGAVYDIPTKTVALTLSGTLNSTTVTQSNINTGANGIANTTAAVGDTQVITPGNGAPTQTCISAGADGILNTVGLAGDDTTTGTGASAVVTSGPNGVCNTAALAADTQVIPVGQGAPNQIAVRAGADLVLSTTPAGDDVRVRINAIQASSGVKDVAGNAVRTTADVVDTDGTIE